MGGSPAPVLTPCRTALPHPSGLQGWTALSHPRPALHQRWACGAHGPGAGERLSCLAGSARPPPRAPPGGSSRALPTLSPGVQCEHGPLCSQLMSVFNPKPPRRMRSFMPRGIVCPRPWDCRQCPVHEGHQHRTQLPLFSPLGPSPSPSRPAEQEEEVSTRRAERLSRTPCASLVGTAGHQLTEPVLGTCVLVSSVLT